MCFLATGGRRQDKWGCYWTDRKISVTIYCKRIWRKKLERKERIENNRAMSALDGAERTHKEIWPVEQERAEIRWFPASSRLIGLVRANVDKFVLPPAVVRKACWRE